MKKEILKFSILLSTILVLTSCTEKKTHKWSEINESLDLLQEVREELKQEIYDLEDRGYDVYGLESIDSKLEGVERLLEEYSY